MTSRKAAFVLELEQCAADCGNYGDGAPDSSGPAKQCLRAEQMLLEAAKRIQWCEELIEERSLLPPTQAPERRKKRFTNRREPMVDSYYEGKRRNPSDRRSALTLSAAKIGRLQDELLCCVMSHYQRASQNIRDEIRDELQALCSLALKGLER